MIHPPSRISRRIVSALPALCAIVGFWSAPSVLGAEEKTKIRLVCPLPVDGQKELVLATKDSSGAWSERGKLDLRPSFISEWLVVPQGELSLCVREGDQLLPKGNLTLPAGKGRSLAILLPGKEKDQYSIHLIDPDKAAFTKGKMLLINSSSVTCTVKLGTKEIESKPNEVQVAEAAMDDRDMYQLLVSHATTDGKLLNCFDRYISGNKEARDYLFLIPDPATVIKVVAMSDFGSFK